ncbi:MAG: hypothetical protein CMJ39_03160 [Phycisphaerae bacterium]|nr:hypothetical protein [Phycisphaerae bacterium]
MKLLVLTLFLLPLLALHACQQPQAYSLQGRSLHAPALPDEVQAQRELALKQAKTILAVHPESEDATIWVGRRTAYLGRYREAIEIYTTGLQEHPESHRLRRHRGHRYITLREFPAAIEDLKEADELSRHLTDQIEPDGMPNAQGKPRSTTRGNILYHLGLARYLTGSFDLASLDFQRCLELARNDDMAVAAAYWMFLSATRAGQAELAREALMAAEPEMDLIENQTYQLLLLRFQGNLIEAESNSHLDAGVDEATMAYGIAMHELFQGNEQLARARLEQLVESTNWAAFGHIAAESDLTRGIEATTMRPDPTAISQEAVQPEADQLTPMD